MRPKPRLGNSGDVRRFFTEGLPYMCKVWAFDDDETGLPVVLFGVRIGPACRVAFSAIHPDARLSKLTIWRMAKEAMEVLTGLGYKEMYAIADPGVEGSVAFAERLGWKIVESSERGDILLWQTP